MTRRYITAYGADILIGGLRMGGAFFENGYLSETVSKASTSPVAVIPARECHHANAADGFAYVDVLNEYWPVRVCRDCRSILKGRCPRPGERDRAIWEFEEQDVIAAQWARQWPKSGRPRAKKPPKSIQWPEAA